MNKRHKSIVEHSLALFLEKGIQNTSIQDIIDRAAISKGTFYNYFSSKTECIRAILELVRYEVSLRRSELLIGKDAKDLDLLIEQIELLAAMNERRGMHAIYEELLYSGEELLKELVIKHRITELEWLSERMVEVYGEELRPYAFESSILFYGMYHNLLFMRRLSYRHEKDLKAVTSSVFRYMEGIIQALIHDHTAVLELDNLSYLKDYLNTESLRLQDAVTMLEELLEVPGFSKKQQELGEALLAELRQSELREAVVQALLNPFVESFEDTPEYEQAKEIVTAIWFDLKRQ